MTKPLDMSKYLWFEDNLEEYLNKQGFTLGKQAERLQKLESSIQFCYIQGVVTDSQYRQICEKISKQFREALRELQTAKEEK